MVVDRQARTIQMVLEEGTRHSTKLEDPSAYEVLRVRAARSCRSIPRACFRAPAPPAASASSASRSCRCARPSCRPRASRRTTRSWRSTRSSPCRWRASCSRCSASRSGASNRKDGKLAAFVLGIAVIFVLLRDHVHGGVADQGLLGAGVAVDVAAEHRARRGRRSSCWCRAPAPPISRSASRCRSGQPLAARRRSGGRVREAEGARRFVA